MGRKSILKNLIFKITKYEFKRKAHEWFVNFLFDIYEKYPFIEWVLCSLCEAEMQIKAVKNKKFKFYLDVADVCHTENNESDAMLDIPKDTLYCNNCPFYNYSKLATLFFGVQSSGYCYYLGKGDFSFIRPTELLWDGCKECGVNIDV